MGNVSHSAERAAVGIAIDAALKKVNKGDREKEIVRLVRFMEKHINGIDETIDYDRICRVIEDREGFVNKYINRILDETDPKVIKKKQYQRWY